MENNTAKHFVLQLGSVISLYLSVSFLLVLLFSIINLLIPSATESYWQIESNSDSVRLGIAMLLVFFPTYIVLTRRVNILRRKESTTEYLGITKWLMYLSLLVGGGVILGDLVAIILAFLNGELTTRFILKAVTLLAVVGAAFFYYIRDTQGYWLKEEKASKLFGAIVSLAVVGSLTTGFFFIETPAAVRELRLDETQITDLQNIQWRISESLAVASGTLPATLEEAFAGFPVPTAPEDRPAYSYEIIANGFKLCATFSHNSTEDANAFPPMTIADNGSFIKNPDNWMYKEGRYCFDRVVK